MALYDYLLPNISIVSAYIVKVSICLGSSIFKKESSPYYDSFVKILTFYNINDTRISKSFYKKSDPFLTST